MYKLCHSYRQVYQYIKPKKRIAALRAAILFFGFDFVLTQVATAIISVSSNFKLAPRESLRREPSLGAKASRSEAFAVRTFKARDS